MDKRNHIREKYIPLSTRILKANLVEERLRLNSSWRDACRSATKPSFCNYCYNIRGRDSDPDESDSTMQSIKQKQQTSYNEIPTAMFICRINLYRTCPLPGDENDHPQEFAFRTPTVRVTEKRLQSNETAYIPSRCKPLNHRITTVSPPLPDLVLTTSIQNTTILKWKRIKCLIYTLCVRRCASAGTILEVNFCSTHNRQTDRKQ